MQRFILAHKWRPVLWRFQSEAGVRRQGDSAGWNSGADGQKAATVGGCGNLHGSDFLLGGEAALDTGTHLGVGLAALVADGLLKGAALALLPVPEQTNLALSPSYTNAPELALLTRHDTTCCNLSPDPAGLCS